MDVPATLTAVDQDSLVVLDALTNDAARFATKDARSRATSDLGGSPWPRRARFRCPARRVRPDMTQAWSIFGDLFPLLVIVVLMSGIRAWRIVRRSRGTGEAAGPIVATAVARVWVLAATIGAGVLTLTPVGGFGTVTGINLVPLRSLVDLATGSVDATVAFRNIAGNVMLFVPIGITLGVSLRGQPRPLASATLTGLVVSLVIEALQYIFAVGRVVDVDDVLLNVAGAWLGAAGVLVLINVIAAPGSVNRSRRG